MELLDVYPVEDTIIGRANKISLALGTRSPIQVSNRLNKIIGSDARSSLRTKLSLQQRLANGSRRTSGIQYLGSGEMPVQMSDDSESESELNLDPALKETDEYKELIKLKRLAKLKKKEQNDNTTGVGPIHRSFSCDSCSMSPIVGIRWKCKECPEQEQVDLCNDCITKGFQNGTHRISHQFEKIEHPEVPWDENITQSM